MVGSADLVSAGVDLGGMGSRFVIVAEGAVIAQTMVPTQELGAGPPEERVSRLATILTSLVPEGRRLSGVGVGASGPVELPRGIIRNPDTLPWFSGFDLAGRLEARLGAPVVIDNDAVTAALGEYRYGAGRGFGRVLVITLGTGIGAAFLSDGRPFRDRNGQHPECGHLPVLPGGERCYCGLIGCWETVACRASLEARLERALGCRDLGQVEQLLRAGTHPGLEPVFSDYGHAVGRGVEILNVTYSPQHVVMCGSVSRFLPYFIQGLRAELERAPGFRAELSVVESGLGDVAGAVGASVLPDGAHRAGYEPCLTER